jgi:hypothetical protein
MSGEIYKWENWEDIEEGKGKKEKNRNCFSRRLHFHIIQKSANQQTISFYMIWVWIGTEGVT